jgi:signal transduction histidine kinase
MPETGYSQGITIATQAIAAALVIRITTRAGREAADTFAALQASEQAAAVEAERRADERLQMRILHNGPVTTLSTAVNMSGVREITPLMRVRAAADLATLAEVEFSAKTDQDTRLVEQLAQKLVLYEDSLKIDRELAACTVPADVAQAFAIATAEALENVARHAGTERVGVRLAERDGIVAVTVRDEGRGFLLDHVPRQRFGVRESVVGQMVAVGGTATVLSRVGQGTEVSLAWRRD